MATQTIKMRPLPPLTAQARLVPLTDEARAAVAGVDVDMGNFPFHIGRERRWDAEASHPGVDRRSPNSAPINDLFLLEPPGSEGFFVARAHLSVEASTTPQGLTFALVDRGSELGTLVNGRLIGGKAQGDRTSLIDRSEIVIGGEESPYRFLFVVL